MLIPAICAVRDEAEVAEGLSPELRILHSEF